MEKIKKQRKNKGFSLVELIVVMAIMAILVGAVAPQVIKYVEKAREAKDLQVVSTVFTAVQASISSSEKTVPPITTPMTLDTVISTYNSGTSGATCYIGEEIDSLLGDSLDSVADVKLKCTSKKGTATNASVYITYNDATGAISVYIANTTATGTATIGPVTN